MVKGIAGGQAKKVAGGGREGSEGGLQEKRTKETRPKGTGSLAAGMAAGEARGGDWARPSGK